MNIAIESFWHLSVKGIHFFSFWLQEWPMTLSQIWLEPSWVTKTGFDDGVLGKPAGTQNHMIRKVFFVVQLVGSFCCGFELHWASNFASSEYFDDFMFSCIVIDECGGYAVENLTCFFFSVGCGGCIRRECKTASINILAYFLRLYQLYNNLCFNKFYHW